MLKIIFWGTGSMAVDWIEHNQYLFANIQSLFVERKHKIGTLENFYNKPIISPVELKEQSYDYLCILSSFFEEIKNELINDFYVSQCKIVKCEELWKLIFNDIDNRDIFSLINELGNSTLLQYLSLEDELLRALLKDYFDYEHLRKSITNKYEGKKYNIIFNDITNKTIWTCWFQGVENAPEIVKCCVASIKRYMPNYKVVIITEQNMKDYIQFPDFIMDKYNKGIITKTHMSDLLRLELLIRYGGIWLDATVLLTNAIPDVICNDDLFLFKYNKYKTPEPRNISSWFIASKPRHTVLMLTREMIYSYWSNNNYLLNYYLFHYFFRLATKLCCDEWNKKLHIVANTELLIDRLFEKFDESNYKLIKDVCFLQKLSYKMKKPDDISNTYYEKILEEYKVEIN